MAMLIAVNILTEANRIFCQTLSTRVFNNTRNTCYRQIIALHEITNGHYLSVLGQSGKKWSHLFYKLKTT